MLSRLFGQHMESICCLSGVRSGKRILLFLIFLLFFFNLSFSVQFSVQIMFSITWGELATQICSFKIHIWGITVICCNKNVKVFSSNVNHRCFDTHNSPFLVCLTEKKANIVGSLPCLFLTGSVKSRPWAVALSRHTSAVLRRMAIWVISRWVMEPSWKRGLNAATWGGGNRVPQRTNAANTTSDTMTVHKKRCCGKKITFWKFSPLPVKKIKTKKTVYWFHCLQVFGNVMLLSN